MKQWRHRFYCRYLAGNDIHEVDVRRREFVLNALLFGLSLAGITSLLAGLLLQHFGESGYRGNTLPDLALATSINLCLWLLAQSRRHILAAYIFLGCMASAGAWLALAWSYELPTTTLIFALLIMVAGMILERRAALIVTGGIITLLLILGDAEVAGRLHPHVDWLGQPLQRYDCLDYALLLAVIGLITWLANLEIDRLLLRTQESRAALQQERDLLEIRVAARTRQLEQAQLALTLELQRFAEFGRLSAHLLHEIANPLTAAALHLELHDQEQTAAIKQVRKNLQHLERYVTAARKQLKVQGQRELFSIRSEVTSSLAILAPIAQRAGVHLVIAPVPAALKLKGDPIKFNQIFSNLVVNAIDAYAEASHATEKCCVRITFTIKGKYLLLRVHDRAKGISADQMSRLFEPFYTTKGGTTRGLGIGLSLVKQTVEQDFSGSIRVHSSPARGTIFTVRLKLASSHLLPSTSASKSHQSKAQPEISLALA